MLKCLSKQHGASWDCVLPLVEFSFNDSINRSTSQSPFQIVYGTPPRGTLELREVKDMERRSAQVEDFVEVMREVPQ